MTSVTRQEFEDLEKRMIKCSTDVWDELAKQSKQRSEYNEITNTKLDGLSNAFKGHTDEEMTKYDEIIEALGDLTTALNSVVVKTEDNTGYIQSARNNEELERRVAEKISEINAPREATKKKIWNTAVGVITTAVLTGTGAGIMVIYDIYTKINGG